jgi:predicted membrane protein
MLIIKYTLNSINYLFYCFFGFTLIDVTQKLIYNDFYLGNITNFFQLLLTIIGVFFAYYKLMTYRRDSATKSRMLEQEAENKEIELFFKRNAKEIKETELMFTKFGSEFLEPFKYKKDENRNK